MARKKAIDNKVTVGNIREVSGKVTIAGGDIYEGYTVEQVSLLLKEITTNYRRKPFDGRCPYKGLDVFEEEDANLFFGRERLVEDLLGRVKESRTVFITGPSGSGKSSLVRAGLIHALKNGGIKGGDRWLYETMKPGREPIKELSLAFSRLKSPELANYFQAHANEINILNECAESVLSARKDQRFVLFVDQFEEVFTQINQEEERLAFLNMLAHVGTVENGRVIVLFAMRSDFVSNCATYPALNELLSQEFRQIGAMQPDELVAAIALPAKEVGLPIEEELIARIITDMKGEPGALPLMQFALKDLFDSQEEKGIIALTLNDYLKRGGIQRSLERHADSSFAKLSEGEQKLARFIFSSLIEVGRGTADTRRTALFDELVPANANIGDVLAIVQKLADARLVITDEQAGKDTVTISHEKLIEAWPWLKKLVNENRDVIALQNEIASDAKEWDDHQRDPSYLYTGARLASAREKLDANNIVLSGLSQLFVETGVKAYADELEAAHRRTAQLRRRSISLTVALIAALIAVGVAVFFDIQSRQRAQIALARQLAAQAQSIYATGNSREPIAVLLAVHSMQLFPLIDAAQVLQNNTLAHPIAYMTHDAIVDSVAFSPDGKYVLSGGCEKTDSAIGICTQGIARVWEAATGKEISYMTHDGLMTSVAFSPDGKYVVSGSWDNTARIWEVSTGKEIARMTHDAGVTSVAFSPDGNYVVSGSEDTTARVWEASTGVEIARMTHDDDVISVAFSPDGKYVVSGSWDNTARIWEVSTGKEIARMTHDAGVTSVAFSPDGKYVVSGGCDKRSIIPKQNVIIRECTQGSARVWEASTGVEIARMTHDATVDSVAFSLDSKYVVSGGCEKTDSADVFCTQGTARVWEASTGKEVARMTHDDDVISVAFSPDGKYVVSGGDITARVWEASTGKEIARMTHDAGVTSVAFSPDSKYVVSGGDITARVWEASTGKEIARMTHDGLVTSVAFSPDGKYVVSGSWDNTARIWEVSTGKEIARMTHDAGVTSVAFSPDSKYVVSGGCDKLDTLNQCIQGTARVWEASTGKEVARMTHDNDVISVAFSPDGKYVVSSGDFTARVWEATTGKEVAHMTHDGLMTSVAFSPDGKYVVSGGGITAGVWEASTGVEIARMTHGYALISVVAFSPDGKYVVTGSSDAARVWEVSTGKEVARMTHDAGVISVAFSPDGKYAVSGSEDTTARVWEASTGKEVARMTHDDDVISVAFSPDGKYVVSGGDITARVWEASTGKEIARMTHDATVDSVAFSPDGKYVVSGSADGTARVWIWRPEDLITDACSRVSHNLTRAEWKTYIGNDFPYQTICPNLPLEPEPTATP